MNTHTDYHTNGHSIVAGKYNINPTPPFVPGFEVAGEIAAVGGGVSGWAVGARVVSMPGWGGYAQYVCAKASTLVAMPDGVDFVKAAACPVAYTTSHLALKEKVRCGVCVCVYERECVCVCMREGESVCVCV